MPTTAELIERAEAIMATMSKDELAAMVAMGPDASFLAMCATLATTS